MKNKITINIILTFPLMLSTFGELCSILGVSVGGTKAVSGLEARNVNLFNLYLFYFTCGI